MKVISKKSTTRLVKGGQYEVDQIWNDGESTSYMEGKCNIRGIGTFSVNAFILLDGSDLPKIKKVKSRIEFSDLKKGDILVPNRSTKTLVKDKYYVISELKEESKIKLLYGGRQALTNIEYVKFEGFPRWVVYSQWKFGLVSKDISRNISINDILGESKSPVIRKKHKRSFDSLSEEDKSKSLVEILCYSMVDKYRNNLSVIDWAINKTGIKYGVNYEDFENVLNLPFKDIIKLIDKLK